MGAVRLTLTKAVLPVSGWPRWMGNVGTTLKVSVRPVAFKRRRIHEALDVLLTIFALLVIPGLLLAAIVDENDPVWSAVGETLDWVIWLGFAGTLVCIFVVVEDRKQALRAHAIDILLVLLTPPFVPASWQALRALRVLRIARLILAGFRLHRYARHFTRTGVVGPAAITLLVLILSSATAIRLIEPDRVDSMSRGLWWALSRTTSMGDGGVALATLPARVIETIVAMSGLAFLSLITAAIATIFVRSNASQDKHLPVHEILERLERIERRLDQRKGNDAGETS